MRNVLRFEEFDSRLRDFHRARRLAVTEVGLASRVIDRDAVNEQPVVVETGHDGRRGKCPVAVAVALHVKRTFAEAVVSPTGLHLDLFGVDGLEPERDPTVGMHARVLVRGTLEVAGFPSSSAWTLKWPPTKNTGATSKTNLIRGPLSSAQLLRLSIAHHLGRSGNTDGGSGRTIFN